MDHDGPELDEDEQQQVREFLKWEDEGEQVVRDGLLTVSSYIPEGKGSEGRERGRRGPESIRRWGGRRERRRGWERSIDDGVCVMFYIPMDDAVLDGSSKSNHP